MLVFLAMHIVMEMQSANDSCQAHCDEMQATRNTCHAHYDEMWGASVSCYAHCNGNAEC